MVEYFNLLRVETANESFVVYYDCNCCRGAGNIFNYHEVFAPQKVVRCDFCLWELKMSDVAAIILKMVLYKHQKALDTPNIELAMQCQRASDLLRKYETL